MPRVLRLSQRTVDLDTGEVRGHGRLRPTELAMLLYLAERPGIAVPLATLHAEVWGYSERVVSRAAYSTASRVRALIEVDPAEPRHLIAERGEGYRLAGAVWETVDPELRPLTNLTEPDRLFGRSEELARIAESPARLWTVVGAGGVGKTRFAIETAWRSGSPGGAWFCDLHLATTEAAVEAEVARVLPHVGRGPVVERLRQLDQALVVLDNLESAGPAGPVLVQRWLEQAPSARFLVTRREPLGLGAERVLRLGPLPLADGIGLLRDRVGRRGPADPAALSEEDAATLWSLVDGLPLSLEIVAANVALVGPEAVVDRLRVGGDLPARRTDGPARHRSLDEVLRWSWDRLTADAREAMATLAVIDGPFGLPAAEAALADPDAATRVADLVDASLLTTDSRQRFALFTTVRNAVRRWSPSPADQVLDRLLAVHLALDPSADDAMDRWGILSPAGLAQLVDRVERRTDLGPDATAQGLRVLVHAAAGEGASIELLLSWLDRASARAVSDEVRAALVSDRALLYKQAGRTAEAIDGLSLAADLARRCGAISEALKADYSRGVVLIHQLRTSEAEQVVAALEAHRGTGAVAHEASAAAALLRASLCDLTEDDLGAERCSRASIAGFRAAGHPSMADRVESNLAGALVHLGRLDEADALLRANGRSANDLLRAEILVVTGAFAEAVALTRHALARRESTYHLGHYASGLARGAWVFLRCGEVALGSACLGAERQLPVIGPFGPVRQATCQALLALLANGPSAAWPHAVEARESATARGLHGAITRVAVLQAELRWGVGDVPGAAAALEDALHGRRPLVVAPAALLLAETWLRLGERDRARDLAVRVLHAGASPPIARARAHALLATCAAIDGALPEAEAHLRQTTGIRGLGQSWLDVHRAWCMALRDGSRPEPVEPSPASPLELALRACAAELDAGVPLWAR